MSKFVHFFSRFYFERSKDQSFAVKINQREPKGDLKLILSYLSTKLIFVIIALRWIKKELALIGGRHREVDGFFVVFAQMAIKCKATEKLLVAFQWGPIMCWNWNKSSIKCIETSFWRNRTPFRKCHRYVLNPSNLAVWMREPTKNWVSHDRLNQKIDEIAIAIW